MPYYRHPKELGESQPEDFPSFATMVEARKGLSPSVETVTFVASDDEREVWQERERERFSNGTYASVPWIADRNRVYSVPYDSSPRRYHFPHLALAHPGLIAYTKNDEHGVLDRQTRVKPGKYLEEFYKDEYTPEQIADFIARCVVELHELKIATATADIVALYSRTDLGFTSCMQRKTYPEYDWQQPFDDGNRPHPVEVYGESDLAVAYLGDSPTDKIKARCVVWPAKKVYTSNANRYGNIPLMKQALAQAGYSQGNIEGAKVRAIRHNGELIMPYVDDIDGATERDGWIVLGDGRVQTGNTTGYGSSYTDREDSDDDSDDDDYHNYTCENCSCDYNYSDMSQGELNRRWCDDCLRDRNTCAVCDRRTFDDLEDVAGESWCERCVTNATHHCAHPVSTRDGLAPCGETWIERAEFDETERDARIETHTAHLCRKCADGQQVCQHCAALFDDTRSACETCGLAVLCNKTLDMFGHAYEATIAIEIAGSLADLDSPIDGSQWWIDTSTRGSRVAGYWVKWADGRTNYTRDCVTLTHSTFPTLDHTGGYQRIADPRLSPQFALRHENTISAMEMPF